MLAAATGRRYHLWSHVPGKVHDALVISFKGRRVSSEASRARTNTVYSFFFAYSCPHLCSNPIKLVWQRIFPRQQRPFWSQQLYVAVQDEGNVLVGFWVLDVRFLLLEMTFSPRSTQQKAPVYHKVSKRMKHLAAEQPKNVPQHLIKDQQSVKKQQHTLQKNKWCMRHVCAVICCRSIVCTTNPVVAGGGWYVASRREDSICVRVPPV